MNDVHPSQGQPLDTSKLDELRMLSDGEEGLGLLGELIDIFLDDTPVRMQDLAAAVDRGDAEASMQAAHALKSSCAQLGALRLSDLFRQMEAQGRAGDVSAAPAFMHAAQDEFGRVRQALLDVKAAG